ncbi:hypothetical protein LXL04_020455 [Taraxacum kok-saghyz]
MLQMAGLLLRFPSLYLPRFPSLYSFIHFLLSDLSKAYHRQSPTIPDVGIYRTTISPTNTSFEHHHSSLFHLRYFSINFRAHTRNRMNSHAHIEINLNFSYQVDTIMDQGNFTLEELLDSRLISFLRERSQIEQLLRYIVEEAPEDAAKGRTFKFPFIACEIFTCEVDIILKTLVEDEELMNLLFSFLEPEHPHSTLLAGYFSKVVVCLLLLKSASLISYIQAHPDIIQKLIDLVGITSIMEVLIRLMGADENLYTCFGDSTQWLTDIDVLIMIVNKFSSSDCPQVHANAAETLCAISKYASQGLFAKISSPSFIGRLFDHALGESRPKSVFVNALSVCICLLDPNRQTCGSSYIYNRQLIHGSSVTTNPDIVDSMLESLDEAMPPTPAYPMPYRRTQGHISVTVMSFKLTHPFNGAMVHLHLHLHRHPQDHL